MNWNRNFRRTILFITAVVMITPAVGAGSGGEKTGEYRFTPGKTLDIDLKGGGSVSVTGWDREGARVTYSDTKRDLADHGVEIQEVRGGLRITSKMIHGHNVSHNLDFQINVPRKMNLEFKSMGGGLELENLEGRFEGKTMGGQLTLVHVDGEARIRSMGGDIHVSKCRLDGKLSTGGGPVLLEDVVGDLEATSGGGNVRYKNVRDRDGRLRAPGGFAPDGMTERTVVITTAGGGIEIDEAPDGARLRTGGGDVEVFDASRFVEVWTGGGDIDIEIRDGWVEAWTGAGDVEIKVEGNLGDAEKGVEVFTGTGDVTVILPDGLSLDMDLEIGYTRNSSQNYKIRSDFDLDITRTDEWDYSHGSPRKYIRGTARIGGGEHKIKIRNTNGDIRIEKAK